MVLNFPIGFYQFHKDDGFNFQLNRFYASGILTYDEVMEIGQKVTSFDVWIQLFLEYAKEAEAAQNWEKSAICYRAAQFYTLGEQKDANGEQKKAVLYEKCLDMFQRAYKEEKVITYDRIPFETGYLPVYLMRHNSAPNGTIVIHGGYDSFIQEFIRYGMYLYERGFDVYMFEGPGQGEVLYRCNIKMTKEWEHCVITVLDYYHLDDVTLIGISLGGYLATRAAANEPRIHRLVMYDLIYDFYGALMARMKPSAHKTIDYLTRHPKSLLWRTVEHKMTKVYFLKWLFKQGYTIYDNVHTPCEYFNHIKNYNTRDISTLVTQDTLVLAGESDIYTVFLKEQLAALDHAKTVEYRLFTKEEHADHHCQMGNIRLVLDVITEWIERVS